MRRILIIILLGAILLCSCSKEVNTDKSNYNYTSGENINVDINCNDDKELAGDMTLESQNIDIKNNELEEYKIKSSIVLLGLSAIYYDIERPDYYSLDYFCNIDGTYTYQRIINEIGEPNGTFGSGIVRDYWKVDDKYILIHYNHESGIVLKVQQCNTEEVEEDLFRNEEYEKAYLNNDK